jgi:hypothetical protein
LPAPTTVTRKDWQGKKTAWENSIGLGAGFQLIETEPNVGSRDSEAHEGVVGLDIEDFSCGFKEIGGKASVAGLGFEAIG